MNGFAAKAADSARWCDSCQAWGTHHSDRHPISPVTVRLAVVGSTQFAADTDATDRALVIIAEAFHRLSPTMWISGGAVGIDTIGADFARRMGLDPIEYLPEHRRWSPFGFKARNILIAMACTHLVAIRHRDSHTYGSGWTADYAEKMGKTVERHLV